MLIVDLTWKDWRPGGLLEQEEDDVEFSWDGVHQQYVRLAKDDT